VSVFVCGIASMIVLTFAAFVSEAGTLAAVRSRAQLAADAAALAAVSESVPGGGGRHEATARAFAEANGAYLLECECRPNATYAQVTVAIDDVTAQARAELDPLAIGPAPVTAGQFGLHPLLRRAVEQLVAASGGRVWVQSGYRPPSRQNQLWERALDRYEDPEVADNWVARPGTSMHERGLAVDLGGDIRLAEKLIEELRLPLWRPMPWEPWHFELAGSRGGPR
jgi:Flp pilus assembly protein TadG